MPEIRYDKLVRSKIPAQIERDGLVPVVAQIEDLPTHRSLLCAKLLEEIGEYMVQEAMDGTGKDELPDMLEAVYALALTHSIQIDELNAIARAKANNRGDLDSGVFLVAISTPPEKYGRAHD